MKLSKIHLWLASFMMVGAFHLSPSLNVLPCPEDDPESCEEEPEPEE